MCGTRDFLSGLECHRLVTGPSSELRDFLKLWGFSQEHATYIYMCLQEPSRALEMQVGPRISDSFALQWNAWLAKHWEIRVTHAYTKANLERLIPNSVVHGAWRTVLTYPSGTRPWIEMFQHKCARLSLLFPGEPELVFREACQQTVQPILAHITKLAEQGICVMDYNIHNVMCLWQKKIKVDNVLNFVVHVRWAPESFTAVGLDVEGVEVDGAQYCLPEKLMIVPSVYASHMFLMFRASFFAIAPVALRSIMPDIVLGGCLQSLFDEVVQASHPHLHQRTHLSSDTGGGLGATKRRIENQHNMKLQRYEMLLQLKQNGDIYDIDIHKDGFIPWFPTHWHILESPDVRHKLLQTWDQTRHKFAYVAETTPMRSTTFIPQYLLRDNKSRENERVSMSTWPIINNPPLTVDVHNWPHPRPEVQLLLHSCKGWDGGDGKDDKIHLLRVQFCLNVLLCEDTLRPKVGLPFFVPPCAFSVSGAPPLALQLVGDGHRAIEEEVPVSDFSGSACDLVLCNPDRRHDFDTVESCGLFALPP